MCSGGACVFEAITTNRDAYAVVFFLVGPKAGYEARVRDFSASWDLGAWNEAYGISTLLHSGTHALRQHAQVIGECACPEAFCWSTDQMPVLQRIPGRGVNY